MYDKELHKFCFEFYTVEKAIEVAVMRGGNETLIRIEVLKDEKSSPTLYDVRVWVLVPLSAGREGWATFPDFPSVHGPSVDAALGQALGFLRERCDNPT